MSEKIIRSSRPYFPKEDIEKILKDIAAVLEDGRLRNGKNLQLFEHTLADYVGAKEAVAFDSDGDALETALRYYGVEGKEVVVCTNSFISMPNSVVYAGGKVVFADIKAETLSMDPESLKRKITDKTRGVIVTHIAGFPNPDLKEIMEICEEMDLFLVEDATHAIGAKFEGRKVGTFGEAAIFAFTPTKVLTTGEGGMLVTNDTRLAEEARRFRYYGSGPGKTEFVNLGRHMMLPEVSAILGIYQLRRIEEFVLRRNEVAKVYDQELSKSKLLRTVQPASDSRGSYYKYPLTLHGSVKRTDFVKLLYEKHGVETGNVFYPPCHMQAVYDKYKSSLDVVGNLPVSEMVLSQTITLPMHAAMSSDDVRFVCSGVLAVLESLTKTDP